MEIDDRPEVNEETRDSDIDESSNVREFPSMFETFKSMTPAELGRLAMATVRVSRGRRASRGII